MTNEQLYLAIGVPTLLNAAMMGLLIAYINAKFSSVNDRLLSVDRRFDELRDLWCSEMHRIEEVLDARLKHLEER